MDEPTPNSIAEPKTLPSSLQVGLKEWDILCSALATGEQTLLLRKGGIYESAGEFEVEHRAFLFFPTFLHQKPEMLKPAFVPRLQTRAAEPTQIPLATAGVVVDIIQLSSRQQMNAIDDEHIWAAPLIDMRFNYKPHNPLYLLVVRSYVLATPATIDNTLAYAGCKSWVPLEHAIDTANARAVLDDATFEQRRRLIIDRLSAAR